jgi:hypothetical protein
MLKSIEDDYEDDLARYRRVRSRLEARLGRKLPKPQVKFQEEVPKIKVGGKLEFLVTGRNGPGYPEMSDEERLAIEERVLQFHDYHSRLREKRILVDEGACCPIWGFGMMNVGAPMSGYVVMKVNSYDEFQSILLADPLFVVMFHMMVALVPFDNSRKRAERELHNAKTQLR